MAQAIEALLASDSVSPISAFNESSAALAALEVRVERLEAVGKGSIRTFKNNESTTGARSLMQIAERFSNDNSSHHLPSSAKVLAPLPDRRLTPSEADGLLTTPAVAKALGLASPSALTNWIGRQQGNGIGALYRGYRLRGKGLLPAGINLGWLWEQASDLPHN